MRILQVLVVTLFVTVIFSNAVVVAQPKSAELAEQSMGNDVKVKLPARGITMDQVKQEIGAAKKELPAVGEPPIAVLFLFVVMDSL